MFLKCLSKIFTQEAQDAQIKPNVYPAKAHKVKLSFFPSYVIKVMQKLEAKGYKAYLVGGCVRDLMAGLKPKDFDVVTNARPDQVLRVFHKSIQVGRRFPIVHVRMGSNIIEVITFRREKSRSWLAKLSPKKRHIDNHYGTIETDVQRRDFTVNSLMLSSEGDLLDYHHGVQDFLNKQVKCIGDADVRFQEDPVRMLRAIRLEAKLGFELEESIQVALKKHQNLIQLVSPQRIFQEIIKLCYQGHGAQSWSLMWSYGVINQVMPWVDQISDHERNVYEKWVAMALIQSDQRFKQDDTLSVSYLIAVLNWSLFVKVRKNFRKKKSRKVSVFSQIFNQFEKIAFERVQPPRRVIDLVRSIYAMQGQLVKLNEKSFNYCIRQSKIRAAIDFLCLRAEIVQELKEISGWWSTYINAQGEEQENMVLQKFSQTL